jgi:hypothetical protein
VAAQSPEEASEIAPTGAASGIGREAEFSALEGSAEGVEEFPLEHTRQGANRE